MSYSTKDDYDDVSKSGRSFSLSLEIRSSLGDCRVFGWSVARVVKTTDEVGSRTDAHDKIKNYRNINLIFLRYFLQNL